MFMEKQGLPSTTGFGWELLRRREGRKRVRSLKLQLFCTLVGLPSAVMSVLGDLLSPTEACLLLMLWPLGLAMRTRSLKLSFWLWTTEEWLFHCKQCLPLYWGKQSMQWCMISYFNRQNGWASRSTAIYFSYIEMVLFYFLICPSLGPISLYRYTHPSWIPHRQDRILAQLFVGNFTGNKGLIWYWFANTF